MDNKKTRQFKCDSCGGEMELHNQRSKYVSCPYCGSVAEEDSEAFKILTKNENPANFPPRSFLKLGATGKLFDKTYKIIGRTSWKSTYQEYWSEDGESGYSSEQWTFDEWLLLDEYGAYLSIIEDNEGYKFSTSFIPKYPSLPTGSTINDFETNKARKATEYGTSEILYFEGESTYLVKPGNKVGFSQYAAGTTNLIAEWRFGDDGEIKEVEFFKEIPVSKSMLVSAFADEEYRKEEEAKLAQKAKVRRTNKRIFLYGGLLNLAIGIILSVVYWNEKDVDSMFASPVYENKFVLADASTDANTGQLVYHTKGSEPADKLTFKITPDDKVVKVSLTNARVPAEAEAMFTVRIFNSAKEQVFENMAFACNYRNYKDGNDAIVDANFNEKYLVDNIDDEFTVQLTIEPKVKTGTINPADFSARVKIYKQGVTHNTGGFIKWGIIMLIISLFIRIPKKKS